MKRLTGRQVRAFVSGIDTEQDVSSEVFYLEPQPSRQPLAAWGARPRVASVVPGEGGARDLSENSMELPDAGTLLETFQRHGGLNPVPPGTFQSWRSSRNTRALQSVSGSWSLNIVATGRSRWTDTRAQSSSL